MTIRQIFAALFLVLPATSVFAASYQLQALGGLSAGQNSLAYGLNDNGMVVGDAYNSVSGQSEAVYWDNGVIHSIGTTGRIRAVNNSGLMVGETGNLSLGTPNGRAFTYQNGVYTDIGTLNGTSVAGAYDVNEAGVITGYSFTDDAGFVFSGHGFRYENGVMTDLGTISNPQGYSRGHGINDLGQITGRASYDRFANSEKTMVTWDAANNLGIFSGPSTYSTGQQINNNGIVVGNGYFGPDDEMRALIWALDGSVTTLGTFGGLGSRALSINDSNVLVGFAANSDEQKRAMVSYDGVNIVDLNTEVLDLQGFVSLDEAYDINESGQIVGVGTLATGERQAFLLTAVPVPAAVWLFGSALGLLGWMRKARIS